MSAIKNKESHCKDLSKKFEISIAHNLKLTCHNSSHSSFKSPFNRRVHSSKQKGRMTKSCRQRSQKMLIHSPQVSLCILQRSVYGEVDILYQSMGTRGGKGWGLYIENNQKHFILHCKNNHVITP